MGYFDIWQTRFPQGKVQVGVRLLTVGDDDHKDVDSFGSFVLQTLEWFVGAMANTGYMPP